MYLKRNNELDVLKLYLRGHTHEFYLREISVLTKIPLKTTQNILYSLEKNNILSSTVRGKHKYFALNTHNPKTKFYLLQAEVYQTILFLDAYPSFKAFLKDLAMQSTIVIFGSFARFKADNNSDVDLLIIQDDHQKIPSHLLPYKIHEIRLTEDSYKKALEQQEALIKEIEKSHIILNNHSFYVNAFWGHYGT